uniref:NADH-ubiquinone oxidoreductase chain 6 n=1 Tax=Coleonyx variegatus TaxID=52435 RepID=A1IGE0_COLVA|nr:NADH dehydrogenase subunit 6 [Coleonyx variegatus]BAF43977.1 NADH dehydrogenase subunit 6 [Coleonyx variegatus]
MSYFVLMASLCFLAGSAAVSANPSPFFGAVGLVVTAAFGCGLLVVSGWSFISLVLFLIYLGGMLVVFAYSVALSAEAYPETWADFSVVLYLVGYGGLVFVLGLLNGGPFIGYSSVVSIDGGGLCCVRADSSGISLLYSCGGPVLLLCGFGLLLALFAVLELTRGLSYGALRAV